MALSGDDSNLLQEMWDMIKTLLQTTKEIKSQMDALMAENKNLWKEIAELKSAKVASLWFWYYLKTKIGM